MKYFIVPYDKSAGDTGEPYVSVEEVFSSAAAVNLGFVFKVLTEDGAIVYDPRFQYSAFFKSVGNESLRGPKVSTRRRSRERMNPTSLQ